MRNPGLCYIRSTPTQITTPHFLTLLNYIKSIDNNNNKTIIIITIIIIIIINIKFPDKSARIASLSSNGNT